MANIIELIAKLRDEASGGLEKLGTNLRKIADVGLEPIARISPTAANALGGLLDKAGPTGLAVQDLVREARRNRGFGDAWGHCLVARGSADAMFELELATWDFAALQVIVEEAGGKMTQFDGSPLEHGRSVLTSNGILHEELVARLRVDTETP